jgi:hypothetical protein
VQPHMPTAATGAPTAACVSRRRSRTHLHRSGSCRRIYLGIFRAGSGRKNSDYFGLKKSRPRRPTGQGGPSVFEPIPGLGGSPRVIYTIKYLKMCRAGFGPKIFFIGL